MRSETITLLVVALAALTTTMAVVITMTTQTAFAARDNCNPDGSTRTCSGVRGEQSIGSDNRNSMIIDDTRSITSTTLTDGSGGGRSANDEVNTVVNGDSGGRSICDAFPTDCDFDGRNAIHERGAGDNSGGNEI